MRCVTNDRDIVATGSESLRSTSEVVRRGRLGMSRDGRAVQALGNDADMMLDGSPFLARTRRPAPLAHSGRSANRLSLRACNLRRAVESFGDLVGSRIGSVSISLTRPEAAVAKENSR